MTDASCLPATAIVVPALNEADFIEDCLASLLDDAPACVCQVIVADGGSTDGTLAVLARLHDRYPTLTVLHNTKRLQAAGVNLAARQADPAVRVLLRADAHAVYPAGFVQACVEALVVRQADSVVVPMRTLGRSGMQRAIAATQNSRLGNGGSAHRIGSAGRYVEHGHHAAFDRATFLRLGGYDESFSHNEDAEYDHRLAQAGGRIWMEAKAVTYFPRRTLASLFRQYMNFGAGRARTLRLHGMRPRLRQMMPLVLLAASVAGIALLPISPWFGLLPLGYAACCSAWGAVAALRTRDPWLLGMGPAAITMHLAWAIGFIRSTLTYRPMLTPTGAQQA